MKNHKKKNEKIIYKNCKIIYKKNEKIEKNLN